MSSAAGFDECLFIVEKYLKASVSQLLSQPSLENFVKYFFFKLCSNLLKAFWVDLKACLGLVLPNQYCLIVIREN